MLTLTRRTGERILIADPPERSIVSVDRLTPYETATLTITVPRGWTGGGEWTLAEGEFALIQPPEDDGPITKITVQYVREQIVSLGIDAPRAWTILREEVEDSGGRE